MSLLIFNRKKLGNYLKKHRVAKNYSQLEVANHLGLKSSQYLSNIERGLCPPSPLVLRKLVKIYKLDRKQVIDFLNSESNKFYQKMFPEKKEFNGDRK